MDDAITDHLTAMLGSAPVRSTSVSGGDVSDAHRVQLEDGRTVFAKTHRSPPEGFFTTEATGLRWLGETGTVPVPGVLGVSDDPALLVLEWLDEGRPTPDTEPHLGQGLAALHRAGAPCFGREDRRTTGSRGLPNEPTGSWPEFYASQRLVPLARLARDSRALDPDVVRAIDRVADQLEELGGPEEPPARLHGDLWAGNRLVDTEGRSWLIDPAAHGGHREFDLAMMRLFGGFGDDCFAAYDDAFPLAEGWQERVLLHQLAPLVVHAIKFGGGYVHATEQAVGRYR